MAKRPADYADGDNIADLIGEKVVCLNGDDKGYKGEIYGVDKTPAETMVHVSIYERGIKEVLSSDKNSKASWPVEDIDFIRGRMFTPIPEDD